MRKCPTCKSRNTVNHGAKINKCYDCDLLFDNEGVEITESVFSERPRGISAIYFIVAFMFIVVMIFFLAAGIFSKLNKIEKRIGANQYFDQHEYEILHSQYPRLQKNIYDIVKLCEYDYGIPATVTISIIKGESDFQECAISYAGACGLMQLMPMTAAEIGVRDIFDPEQNIKAGVRYYHDCRFVAILKCSFHVPFTGDDYESVDHIAIKLYNCGYNWRKISYPKETEIYSRLCMARINESEKIKMRMEEI
jgi:soluble lytic murein transglycosylase-like protein